MNRRARILLALASLATLLATPPAAFSASRPLEAAFQGHGSMAKWKSYGGVAFDQTTSFKTTKTDHELFDLRSRDGLITSDKYSLGASGGEVWVKPGLDALGGTPPRFYMWLPFYFFGMPFVLGDPGATETPLGQKTFQGQEYDAVKVTFKKGTGDSSDDFYVAYLDPKSGRLKLVNYVVTYEALRKGKPLDQLPEHALVYDEWQEAGGLRVPKRGTFYNWKEGQTEGKALGEIEFSHVQFSVAAPDPTKFKQPADAVIAPKE